MYRRRRRGLWRSLLWSLLWLVQQGLCWTCRITWLFPSRLLGISCRCPRRGRTEVWNWRGICNLQSFGSRRIAWGWIWYGGCCVWWMGRSTSCWYTIGVPSPRSRGRLCCTCFWGRSLNLSRSCRRYRTLGISQIWSNKWRSCCPLRRTVRSHRHCICQSERSWIS